MGLQINQYPNTTVSLDPLAVFDVDNWTGAAFQSEQVPMSVMEGAFSKNIINSDLTQTANRVQDFAGFQQYWKNNNQLVIESASTPVSGHSIELGGFGTTFNDKAFAITNNIGTELMTVRGEGVIGIGTPPQTANLATIFSSTKTSMYVYNYEASKDGIEILNRGDNSTGITSTLRKGVNGYAGQLINTASGGAN